MLGVVRPGGDAAYIHTVNYDVKRLQAMLETQHEPERRFHINPAFWLGLNSSPVHTRIAVSSPLSMRVCAWRRPPEYFRAAKLSDEGDHLRDLQKLEVLQVTAAATARRKPRGGWSEKRRGVFFSLFPCEHGQRAERVFEGCLACLGEGFKLAQDKHMLAATMTAFVAGN